MQGRATIALEFTTATTDATVPPLPIRLESPERDHHFCSFHCLLQKHLFVKPKSTFIPCCEWGWLESRQQGHWRKECWAKSHAGGQFPRCRRARCRGCSWLGYLGSLRCELCPHSSFWHSSPGMEHRATKVRQRQYAQLCRVKEYHQFAFFYIS